MFHNPNAESAIPVTILQHSQNDCLQVKFPNSLRIFKQRWNVVFQKLDVNYNAQKISHAYLVEVCGASQHLLGHGRNVRENKYGMTPVVPISPGISHKMVSLLPYITIRLLIQQGRGIVSRNQGFLKGTLTIEWYKLRH